MSPTPAKIGDATHAARVNLLLALRSRGYAFITPTPETQQRVIVRADKQRAQTLRDIFGWSLPFAETTLPGELAALLDAADALEETEAGLRARLRVSSLEDDLFLHSAFPADADDAVFFGPDTYRFAAFLGRALCGRGRVGSAVDVGAGAGAGAVTVARTSGADHLVLCDVNPWALTLARANCEAAGVKATFVETEGLQGVSGAFDLVVANPPYIAGATGQTYSEGGDMHGARLSLDWALEACKRLNPGGRLALYTGSAIIDGEDGLQAALAGSVPSEAFRLDYREIDPDVFGEELGKPAYADVERIAVVGAVVDRLAEPCPVAMRNPLIR